MRHLRLIHICLSFVVLRGAAHAQERLEVYATLNTSHASGVPTGLVLTSGAHQPQYTSFTLAGLGGGATLNILRLPIFALGVDVHGSTHHGVAAANAFETALFGLKLSARIPHSRFKPWIAGSAGLADTHARNISSPGAPTQAGNPSFAAHYTIATGTAGLDYRLASRLDLRLLDVSSGSSFGVFPGISLWSFNSGVVLRF